MKIKVSLSHVVRCSMIKFLSVYFMGIYMLNAVAGEVEPNKYEKYSVSRSIGIVLQIALAPEIQEGNGRFGGTGIEVINDKLLVRASVHFHAGDESHLFSLAEDAIKHPCKYLSLPDANDRLMSLVDKNPDFPRPSSLYHEISNAKVILDCPSGLLNWQKEKIEKMRPRWDIFRSSLDVSVRLANESIRKPNKTDATRNIKFKGGNHG